MNSTGEMSNSNVMIQLGTLSSNRVWVQILASLCRKVAGSSKLGEMFRFVFWQVSVAREAKTKLAFA